jgi:hypothetical protein
MGREKGAEVEASTLKVNNFAYCTKFCAQVVTKFRRILWNSAEYRGNTVEFCRIPWNSAKTNSAKFWGISMN